MPHEGKTTPGSIRHRAWLVIYAMALGAAAAADLDKAAISPAKPDKSQYHLFNPTPDDQLREMNALYDSPYTVDAGHFQIESYLLLWGHKHDFDGIGENVIDTLTFASSNLKAGLLNDLDLQLSISPYTLVRTHDRMSGAVTRQRGFGDIVVRLKYNLWGNDGGKTAFALEPFVKLPTNQDRLGNNSVEGGLILPFSAELRWGWWLGTAPRFAVARDIFSDGYHSEFANTTYLWHEIIGKLSGYTEMYYSVSTERNSSRIGTIDLGLTWCPTGSVQVDTGVYLGITRAANDYTPFLGLSYRF